MINVIFQVLAKFPVGVVMTHSVTTYINTYAKRLVFFSKEKYHAFIANTRLLFIAG